MKTCIFYKFNFTWINFGIRDGYKNVFSHGEFLENQRSNRYTLLTGVLLFYIRDFHIYFQIWAKFDARGTHVMLLNMCEFCENRLRNDCTFIMAVNVILCAGVLWNRITYW
jgi:hypothetical protein